MKPSWLEATVFAVGLAGAIAAGITAYDRHGIYGNGPGGSGFGRVHDPISDASLRMHETLTSGGRMRRVFAPDGTVVEVDLDRDNDGNVDECVRVVHGRLAVGFSRSNDGVIDAWLMRDDNGQPTRIEISTRRNHRVDRWEYYKDGALTRVAVDANGDGRPD